MMNDTLIGIIIGAILTGVFSWFIEWRKAITENALRLREKREEVYLRVLDVLTRHEKCYREKRIVEKEYEEYKKLFNDLLSYMMVYATRKYITDTINFVAILWIPILRLKKEKTEKIC